MRAELIILCIFPLTARAARAAEPAGAEDAFHAAAKLFRESKQDRSGATEAFRQFVERYPHSARVADAYFAVGETLFDRALAEADADSSFTRDRLNGRIPDSALKSFKDAEDAYEAAEKKANDDGLRATARYRLGEVAYNERDWARATKDFQTVLASWPKSYLAPSSMLALVYSALAREDFKDAQTCVKRLSESYPERMKDPAVAFVQGVLALHDGDYAQAERLLSPLETPQARYYLGKTYLLWQKPLLAATVFNKLSQDCPVADLREAASFYLGDAFFLSKDYDGAIDRYSSFVKSYPFSRFKVAALYRIGSSSFEKGDYGQARLSFGSLLSQFPEDFYASLSRYFIGESYLVVDQMREALFAYAEVVANGRKDIQPEALYRLAWAQQALGDFSRAAQTCQTFLDAYPSHPLAKNVYLILGNSEVRLKKQPLALAAFQRILDTAPGTDVAEEALFLMLKLQYDQKNYAAILTSYQYILRQLPQSLSKWRGLAYLTAAETYLRLDRVDEAKTIYEMVLKVYPSDLAAIYAQDGLAWCYELSGHPKEALAARNKLTDMLKVAASSSAIAGVNDLGIADSFYAQKDFQNAYGFYDKYAADHPGSPALATALYRAGMSLYRMKYYSQAVETWQKLVEKAPSSPEAEKASAQIADTLFRGGKQAEATAAYEKLLERSPKGPQAAAAALRLAQLAYYANRDDEVLDRVKRVALDYAQSGEASEALDLAEAVFDRAPQRDFQAYFSGIVDADPRGAAAGEAQFRLGRRLFEKKDYAAAGKALERFSVDYTGHPSLSKAQLLLGDCYEQQQMLTEAAAAFERFAQNYPRDPDVPRALFKLGSAEYGLKQYAKAASAWERLLADYPKSDVSKAARFNLALAYRDAGQLDAAGAAYSAYISGGVTDDEAQTARWEIFQLAKQRKDARAARQALEEIRAKAAPGSDTELTAVYEEGELAASSGDEDGAVKAFNEAATMKPSGEPHRLQALVRLSEIYEKQSKWAQARAAYEDIARNAKPEMAAAARERIKQLDEQSRKP